MDNEAMRKLVVADLKALGLTNEPIYRLLVERLEEDAKRQRDGRRKPEDVARERAAELKAAIEYFLTPRQ